jgi:hypothetical protein
MMKQACKTAAATAALILVTSFASRAADQQLNMASWGGIFKEATQKNIADPFTKATGIPVSIADVGGGWAAKIEAQKAAGHLQWDIIDSIDAGSAAYLEAQGMLEHFPADLKAKLEAASLPGTVSDYMIEEGSTAGRMSNVPPLQRSSSTRQLFLDRGRSSMSPIRCCPSPLLPAVSRETSFSPSISTRLFLLSTRSRIR